MELISTELDCYFEALYAHTSYLNLLAWLDSS